MECSFHALRNEHGATRGKYLDWPPPLSLSPSCSTVYHQTCLLRIFKKLLRCKNRFLYTRVLFTICK